MKKLLITAALVSIIGSPALAQQGPPKYLGEVFTIPGDYCPEDSVEADGKVLEIRHHMPLFSIMGNEYGGDGQTTFALPNFTDKATKADTPKIRYCIVINGYFPSRPRS